MKWFNVGRKVQPADLVKVLLTLLASNEAPFSEWRDLDALPLVEQSDWMHDHVKAYQLHVFFELLADVFGREFAASAEKLGRDNSLRGDVDIANLDEMLRWMGVIAASANEQTWPREFWMAIAATKEQDPSRASREDAVLESDSQVLALAHCLAFGRYAAVEGFQPVISNFCASRGVTESDETPAFQPLDSVLWSPAPGCFERHLQRRHHNTLFRAQERNVVTKHELWAARARDRADSMVFRCAHRKLVNDLDQRTMPTMQDVVAALQSIDDLIHRGLGIGQIVGENVLSLLERRTTLVLQVADSLASGGEPVVASEWLKTDLQVRKSMSPYSNLFVAQVTRLKAGEVVAATLSEDVETLRLVCSAIGSKGLEEFKRAAAVELALNPDLPQALEKVHVLFPKLEDSASNKDDTAAQKG